MVFRYIINLCHDKLFLPCTELSSAFAVTIFLPYILGFVVISISMSSHKSSVSSGSFLILCHDRVLNCHEKIFLTSSQNMMRHSFEMLRHSSSDILVNLHDLCHDRDFIIATKLYCMY